MRGFARGKAVLRTRAIAVLGTDTEVGKTIVTGALGLALRCAGIEPAVYKPVASGCLSRGGKLVSRDALWLKRLLKLSDPLDAINPVAYRAPLAPWPAARLERRPFLLHRALMGFGRLARSGRTVLVEGIGGVLVPLSRRMTSADFCSRLRLPAVLVAHAGLGTINHTLLSLEALRRREIRVKGVILNMATGRDRAEISNPSVIRTLSGVPVLAVLPKVRGAGARKGLTNLSRRLGRRTLGALFGPV